MVKVLGCILDMSLENLQAWCVEVGEAPFRGKQIFEWIYRKRILNFSEMTNLPKSFRSRLGKIFLIEAGSLAKRYESRDGSIKYIFRLTDGAYIESVFLPHTSHFTICVSSQVGCALGCRFCATGRLGIIRNLSMGEIIYQVLYILREVPEDSRGNIVFMGMGEPLLNLENVTGAIKVITSEWGLRWSRRRITLSTAGILPELKRFSRDFSHVNLAVSLNAPDERIRSRLMPINKKYPLKVLLPYLRHYPLPTRSHRITFEYIMIKGVNDSEEHAEKLVKLLKGIRCKINLIPMNDVEGGRYRSSGEERIFAFQDVLVRSGYLVRIRRSLGGDIKGACGQLVGYQFEEGVGR